jgi:hypothetical protein
LDIVKAMKTSVKNTTPVLDGNSHYSLMGHLWT